MPFTSQNYPLSNTSIILILKERKLSEKYLSQDTWLENGRDPL